MSLIIRFFEQIMNGCYAALQNYGYAIILFTFISKLILLPVTIWTYFNSIKMIRIQPEINECKAKYYGQPDLIGEEQNRLFKREKYNPFLSVIPLVLQLVLLMSVIEVIRSGMKNPAINMTFLGLDLGAVPASAGISLIGSPILAGLSSLILCLAQNRSNVLQSEQSAFNRYGTLIFSVGLSLYLGWFVPLGTCLYWICSNLFAVLQLYVMNAIVRPRRFVDYERLEKSREQLKQLSSVGKKRESWFSPNKRKERADYKRFFSVANKHVVFYAERRGFYKYFKGIIEYLLAHSKMTIHYITSSPDDPVFELAQKNPQFRAYYIGDNRMITLMMKMDADIVVMTTPDLENYQLKRSYVKKDIEYIYLPHGMTSPNLQLHQGALDHFDTIFCTGKLQVEELNREEVVRGLTTRKKVEWGYALLDEGRAVFKSMPRPEKNQKSILIAPSWQKDNIVDTCLKDILATLSEFDYHITVRPHPQHIRHQSAYMEQLKKNYESNDLIDIQTDFSSNQSLYEADILITDWSSIALEYALTTLKPVLFINTPMKVMNSEYQTLGIEPVDIWMRNVIGKAIEISDLGDIEQHVEYLMSRTDYYHEVIQQFANDYVFNLDRSSEVGAHAILDSARKKVNTKQHE